MSSQSKKHERQEVSEEEQSRTKRAKTEGPSSTHCDYCCEKSELEEGECPREAKLCCRCFDLHTVCHDCEEKGLVPCKRRHPSPPPIQYEYKRPEAMTRFLEERKTPDPEEAPLDDTVACCFCDATGLDKRQCYPLAADSFLCVQCTAKSYVRVQPKACTVKV
jgi:hypothetical protein